MCPPAPTSLVVRSGDLFVMSFARRRAELIHALGSVVIGTPPGWVDRKAIRSTYSARHHAQSLHFGTWNVARVQGFLFWRFCRNARFASAGCVRLLQRTPLSLQRDGWRGRRGWPLSR